MAAQNDALRSHLHRCSGLHGQQGEKIVAGMKPKRIQRKRIKGWRIPPNAVYVGPPTAELRGSGCLSHAHRYPHRKMYYMRVWKGASRTYDEI